MLELVREEFADVEFLDDFPDKTVSIHKIEREEDQEEGKIDFPLIDQQQRQSLGERSHLINKMPAGFRIGYVFADVVKPDQRKQISERCRDLYNQQN